MTDPQRLLQGEDADVAALLRSAREDEPAEADRRAVAAAIGLSVGATVATAAVATKGVKLITLLKIGGAMALVFSVGVMTGVKVERARKPVAPPEATVAAPIAVAPAISVVPVATVAPVVSASAAPSAVVSAAAPMNPTSSSAPATAASLLAQETLLLGRARAAIARHDYRDAIAALDAYDVVAPSGVLLQESRALRVQALAEQGSRLLALDLGHKFLEQFPASPYAKRVRAIVESLEAQ
jgi:hypothetical protein